MHRRTIEIKKHTYDIMHECKEIYLREYPEDDRTITHDFIVRRALIYYKYGGNVPDGI